MKIILSFDQLTIAIGDYIAKHQLLPAGTRVHVGFEAKDLKYLSAIVTTDDDQPASELAVRGEERP